MTTIETLTAQIRARHPAIMLDLRGRRTAKGWTGFARVGHAGGQRPIWQGQGPTKAEAIAEALGHAHDYWAG